MVSIRAFACIALAAASAASAAPDLTFTSVATAHVPYRRGVEIQVAFTLRNIGNQVSSNPVLSIRLSSDTTINLSDTNLGEKLYAALLPGESLPQIMSGDLPANIAPGQHFIGMYAQSIGDGNPANNGRADMLAIEVYCPGDTDGNQVINFADLNTVLAQFGQTAGVYAGDVNGDTDVNFADLNLVLANFGVTGC